jgi:hypothetical protein
MATAKTATSKRSYSPADLADRAVQRRAVEAVIWGMPAVNFDRMLRAAIENGGKANQVMLHGDDCSRPEVQLLSRTVERGPVLVDGAVSSGSTSGVVHLQQRLDWDRRRLCKYLDGNRRAAERHDVLGVEGGVAAPLGPNGITAPFDGQFLYCSSQPVWTSGEYWECQGAVSCDSHGHQFTLVRR